jgi:hypothetical protein
VGEEGHEQVLEGNHSLDNNSPEQHLQGDPIGQGNIILLLRLRRGRCFRNLGSGARRLGALLFLLPVELAADMTSIASLG